MREEQIEEFPWYRVRPNGEILNQNGVVLTPSVNLRGILFVGLYYHGVRKTRAVAPIVANTYLEPHPNPEFDTPIHLDGVKANCDVNNMMWRPRWFAVRWHNQFERGFPVLDAPLIDEDSGDIYRDSLAASMCTGVLEAEIVASMIENARAWPTYQRFREV